MSDPQYMPESEADELAEMVAPMQGVTTRHLGSLAEAKRHSDSVIILDTAMGDQTYVVVSESFVRCAEDALRQLLSDLDYLAWADADTELPTLAPGEDIPDGGASGGARLHYEILALADGSTHGLAAGGLWVHPDFIERRIEREITDVLLGVQDRLNLTAVN